jgi:hypothetical protein
MYGDVELKSEMLAYLHSMSRSRSRWLEKIIRPTPIGRRASWLDIGLAGSFISCIRRLDEMAR